MGRFFAWLEECSANIFMSQSLKKAFCPHLPVGGGGGIENEAYNYNDLSHTKCNACNWRNSYGIELQQS